MNRTHVLNQSVKDHCAIAVGPSNEVERAEVNEKSKGYEGLQSLLRETGIYPEGKESH